MMTRFLAWRVQCSYTAAAATGAVHVNPSILSGSITMSLCCVVEDVQLCIICQLDAFAVSHATDTGCCLFLLVSPTSHLCHPLPTCVTR
jgi:hypothetical protein